MTLSGFIPPLSTPMLDGELDIDSCVSMLASIADDVDGYLVGGSVGEISSLTLDERIALLHIVSAERSKRHALCFSVADNSIVNTHRLVEAAGEAGADLLMVSAPNYFKLGYAEFEEYLRQVAERSSVDICLYDNPLATHMTVSVEDIRRLADAIPRLTHVKVTDTSLGKVGSLVEQTDLQVFSGEDAVLWHQLSEGAIGAMVALPLICPGRVGALWRAIEAGDWESAYAAYLQAAAFIHLALGGPDYVAVIKHVLLTRGVIRSSSVRAPLRSLDPSRAAEVNRALGALDDDGERVGRAARDA